MTSPLLRLRCLLAGLALGFPASEAGASPGDIVLAGVRAPISDVRGVTGQEVILYGPFAMTPALRGAKDAIYLYVDGVQYGGQIATAIFYVVDASQGSGKPWRIDPRHYVGSFATMQDGRTEPTQVVRSIHDYEVAGTPHLPFTHARKMRSVLIAVVVEKGAMKFGKLVVSPDPPEVREAAAPAAATPGPAAPKK
jgi:hypothetical protein